MQLLEFLKFKPKRTTAQVAKERLQIIVSHENAQRRGKDFIKDLQQEILEVISKYINIDKDKIKVQLEKEGDHSILELNVTLPENEAMPNNVKCVAN